MRSDPRLYVALDLPSVEAAEAMIETLGEVVGCYKIGLQLLPVGGIELGQRLKARGKKVFHDFKFHDIGTTVEKATRSVAGLKADLLTVHARPDVMRAAVRGRGDGGPDILGVTVLTSLDRQTLSEIGYHHTPEELVMHRVKQAVDCGMDGVVAAPPEAARIRAAVPEGFLIVTPGVRLAAAAAGEHKRTSTPGGAIRSGASHIVVGRPVTQAPDPRAAALNIIADMNGQSQLA